jgi:hypothetical protein
LSGVTALPFDQASLGLQFQSVPLLNNHVLGNNFAQNVMHHSNQRPQLGIPRNQPSQGNNFLTNPGLMANQSFATINNTAVQENKSFRNIPIQSNPNLRNGFSSGALTQALLKGNLNIPRPAQSSSFANLSVETKPGLKGIDLNGLLFPQTASPLPYGTFPSNLLGVPLSSNLQSQMNLM